MLQVVPLHLAPVWQLENIRAFPFNQEGSLMGGGYMAHELRIAEPAIGHDHRRRQVHAASAECCHASIQHALYPVQFVPARRPRAGGVGPTDGQVDGDDQLALAKDHDQQDPINAGEHPVFLPTPPGAHHAQLIAILFEHRIIRDQGPLPAAARCLAFAGGVTPQRFQHLHAQASKPLEPGALGERTEQAGGQVLVPPSHATQFRVGAAPEQRGTHHSDDFPQELVLAAQAPFDLGHEVFRQPQVIEGLPESLGGVLRLAAVTFKALPRCEAAAVSGFGMFFGASFGWGHSVLRCSVGDFCGCSLPKRTRHMPPRICDSGATAASGAPRTSCFLLSTMCGIHTPERPVPFPHRLLYTSSASGGWVMTFEEILDQALAMLQRRGRLTYGTLQRQFQLDDAALATLKDELLYSQPHVVDDAGRGLLWTGATGTTPDLFPSPPPPLSAESRQGQTVQVAPPPGAPRSADAERRQLTVLFCDLVDSTGLASQLDPEELRQVVQAYQATCAKVIARFEGHIAQYLGDGLLVYFGYPLAHEDDAQRAVRAGLGIVEAMGQLHTSLGPEREVHLAVRLGIHTGLVVVGDVGDGSRQEQLALGETPNVAARLQGLAAPNTLVISAATFQLLGGFFACQPLGTRPVEGIAQPLAVYRVLYESMARSRLEAASSTGWTPLVGREQEIGVLLERWAQVKDGLGQVVLLSGEAGIGKSRLVQGLTDQVAAEPQAWLTPCQCSPYHQHTALYPLIDLLERVVLCFDREESPQQKVGKLEGFLVQYGLPLAEAVPLFAALLSLPLPADYAPVLVSPEQQKQQTLHALLTILLRIAAQQPVLFVMEDLHWVDPTTLEWLSLLVDQGPTARLLTLLTFRPDFSPPWTGGSHLTQVTLPRLQRRQAAEMTDRVAHGKALPSEVVEQVVTKTDGV